MSGKPDLPEMKKIDDTTQTGTVECKRIGRPQVPVRVPAVIPMWVAVDEDTELRRMAHIAVSMSQRCWDACGPYGPRSVEEFMKANGDPRMGTKRAAGLMKTLVRVLRRATENSARDGRASITVTCTGKGIGSGTGGGLFRSAAAWMSGFGFALSTRDPTGVRPRSGVTTYTGPIPAGMIGQVISGRLCMALLSLTNDAFSFRRRFTIDADGGELRARLVLFVRGRSGPDDGIPVPEDIVISESELV